MKIVFFGTPAYVIPILDKIYKTYGKGKDGLLMVVTQPPKPAGREKRLTYSPADNWAFEKRIPKTFSLDEVPAADLGITASFGKIIPESVINKFKYGILNIHPSLLPKYRGSSPVAAAIAAGETQAGLTVIKMDKQMDHGPIISFFKEEIQPTDTAEGLRDRLFARAADFLIALIPGYISGKVKPKEQNHKEATFTKLLAKEDGYIDVGKTSPAKTERFIRAMSAWPGAWTYVRIENKKLRLKLLRAHLEKDKLVLDEVQLEGKNPVKWQQLRAAYPSLSLLSS